MGHVVFGGHTSFILVVPGATPLPLSLTILQLSAIADEGGQ
jgi:hypothetical protein